jgi:uncharacterized glyoxalase superfamily protein PhnB
MPDQGIREPDAVRLYGAFAEVIYEDPTAAVAWLPDAFGLLPGRVVESPEGVVTFAEMRARVGTVLLRAPERQGEGAPRFLFGSTQQLCIPVNDPDAHHRRARAMGAEIVLERRCCRVRRSPSPTPPCRNTARSPRWTGRGGEPGAVTIRDRSVASLVPGRVR